MKKYIQRFMTSLCVTLSILFPSLVFAHEQWFIDPTQELPPLPNFFIEWSATKIAIIAVAVVVFGIALFLHYWFKKRPFVKHIHAWLGNWNSLAPQIVRGALGALMLVAGVNGALFAPDLHLTSFPLSLAISIWVVQYVLAFALIFGVLVRPAAIIGTALYAVTFFFFPAKNLMSYVGFAGIFVYLVFTGSPVYVSALLEKYLKKYRLWFSHHGHYGIMIMRILLGLSFIFMGVAFKLLTPQHTLALLQTHDMNFIQWIGFRSFSNEMFVFAAGVCEVLFGLLLTLNILPRLVSLKLFVLFALTIFEFGLPELFGHLPIFAIFFAIATQKKEEA